MDMKLLKVLIDTGTTIHYEKDNTIHYFGNNLKKLYFVNSGTLSVILQDCKNNKLTHFFIDSDNTCGEGAYFSKESNISIIAESDVIVTSIDHKKLKPISRQYPELLFYLAEQTAIKSKKVMKKNMFMTFRPVKERIQYILEELSLLSLSQDHAHGKVLKITRSKLGSLVGCTRETAGIAIRALEKEGVLQCNGRKIIVMS
jgi:CRP/FNR family transcriptional regulator, cyclic AMP receptor protein